MTPLLIRAFIVGLFWVCAFCPESCCSVISSTSADYQLVSDHFVSENESSEYITQAGNCERPHLENGNVEESKENYTAGERVQISCQNGYRFQVFKSRSMMIICHQDGTWKDAMEMMMGVPKCEKIGGCSFPPSISNGYVGSKDGGYMPGDVAPVTCNNGFYLSPRDAKPLVICTNDGQWRALDDFGLPSCKAVEDCSRPANIANGFFQVISPDGAIINNERAKAGSRVIYHCATDYLLTNGSTMLTCTDGSWRGDLPTCRLKLTTDRCSRPPSINHARPYLDDKSVLDDDDVSFPHDTRLVYICDYGFYQQGASLITCITGEWIGQGPKCLPEEKYCISPPALDHGDYSLHGKETSMRDRLPAGTRAFYYCNSGYRLKEVNFSVLTCVDGLWNGNITTCVQRTNCDSPMDIENGNWIIESLTPDFRIGTKVSYECYDGFKAVGATEVTCQAPGYWSDYGPRCLPLDLYCAQPNPPLNGFFMCKPSHCDFFRVGTEVHHICNKNYEPQPSTALVQTCLPGGVWSNEKPLCLPINYSTTGTYSLNASSVTVVVSTACGVLGLLVSIMAIVLLKRRMKPRRRLCPPTPGPPSGSSQNLEDQDREALIPYIDFASSMTPSLPSYEEAISSQSSPSPSPTSASWANPTRHSHREFRSVQGSRASGAPWSFVRDHMSDSSRNPLRNSMITVASSITRADNGSAAFGSIETVNVSDATSTSVTVDTCDSTASNPSIAMSHRAAAGSIDLSFANEISSMDGGPHTTDRRDHEVISPAAADVASLDHYHCDTNRPHSESTPILEVPEDGKDD